MRIYDLIKKAGNKAVIKKIQDIVTELRSHPTKGTGQPEQLKYELTGYWSRRIDKKNRMIYRIEEEKNNRCCYICIRTLLMHFTIFISTT